MHTHCLHLVVAVFVHHHVAVSTGVALFTNKASYFLFAYMAVETSGREGSGMRGGGGGGGGREEGRESKGESKWKAQGGGDEKGSERK